MHEVNTVIAEIAGVFAADGSMQEAHICFWGNPIEDKEYYDLVLKDLFKKAFAIDIRPHLKESNGVYGFYVCKRPVLDYFKNTLEFKPGPKTSTVIVPRVIMESNDIEIQKAFIRGFMAADGCLNFFRRKGSASEFNKKFRTAPRISIASVSKRAIQELHEVLETIGIKNCVQLQKSKNLAWKDTFRIFVNGRQRIEKWNYLIGFSNPRDKTKYDLFQKFGFVPPFTSIQQRYKILNKELDIYSLYQGP